MFGFGIYALAFFCVLCFIVFLLKRVLAWLDRHGYICYTGHVPTYGSLGNAFLELQSLAEPQKQHVIEVHEDEKNKLVEDDEAGPDAQRLRQLLRTNRGDDRT